MLQLASMTPIYELKKQNQADSLWPRSVQVPVKLDPNKLLQVTGHFDSADIGRVPLRPDVVVLHDAGRVEVVDEGLGLLPRLGRLLGDAVVDGRVAEVGVRVEPVVVSC